MSMNLREWGSNSDTLRTSFAKEDRFDGAEMKVLGLIWNMYDDNVHIPIKESDELETYTKRHILKKTASVFDPLGFFNPVLLNAKLLLRELWKLGIDWDEPVKDQYANQWKEILKDINKIKDKKLQRFVGSKDAELLCFCDASSKAYGTSIYLRCKENGQTLTNLIFSKSRIAPLKETSLPRLELLAVLIGARSINFIEKSLQLNVQRKILWTDSQCVLHWLKSKKILTPFVQRRIEEIQSTEGIEFRYVSTDQNPADIASRGSTTKLLNESDIWWHGPNWLQNDHNSWPTWNTDVLSKHIMNSISGETKGPKVLYEVSTLAEEDLANNMQEDDQQQQKNRLPPFEMKSTEFSSMSRLLRVTAWANRFINNVRKIDKQTGYLNSNELKEAKKLWIYHVQYEMAQMITKTITTKDNNIINSLGLQLDESGMIKCNGRFTNSPNMP